MSDNQIYVLHLVSLDMEMTKDKDMVFEPLSLSFHSPKLALTGGTAGGGALSTEMGSSAITGLDTCLRKPLVVTCGALSCIVHSEEEGRIGRFHVFSNQKLKHDQDSTRRSGSGTILIRQRKLSSHFPRRRCPFHSTRVACTYWWALQISCD